MSNEKRVDIIKSRLQNTFAPLYLSVIDESAKHKGHVGYQGGGRHFAIVISANCFTSLSRVDAHRQINALFADMMPDIIHALRIKII